MLFWKIMLSKSYCSQNSSWREVNLDAFDEEKKLNWEKDRRVLIDHIFFFVCNKRFCICCFIAAISQSFYLSFGLSNIKTNYYFSKAKRMKFNPLDVTKKVSYLNFKYIFKSKVFVWVFERSFLHFHSPFCVFKTCLRRAHSNFFLTDKSAFESFQ